MPEPTVTRKYTVNFFTPGLTGVGYRIPGAVTGRVTSGVAEEPSAPGVYTATVTHAAAHAGPMIWDDGGSPPAYGVVTIRPSHLDMAQAVPESRDPTVAGALSGSLVVAFGRIVKDTVGRILSVWFPGKPQSEPPTAQFDLDNPYSPTSRQPR